jgi:hypothetical protein
MKYILAPHEDLLVSLCRLSFSESETLTIKEKTGVVKSWKSFVWLANEHGISALVYRNLEKLALLEELPDDYSAILHKSYMISLARNTYLLEKLSEAVAILDKRGIRVGLLKGMALELGIYGNNGLRQMNDVDVLIDRDICMKAWKILKENGFTSIPHKSPLYKLILLYEGKHLPELHKEDLSLEIHHNLFPGTIEVTRKMISESSSLIIGHNEMRMPPSDLHFLYLVRHLHYHESQGESQLRLYTDLFMMATHYRDEIFTESLTRQAELTGGLEYMAGRLYILKEFWGLALPDSFEEIIKSVNKSSVLDDFLKFLTKPKGHKPTGASETYVTTLKKVPGLHRKIIHITGELFPSLTFMKFRYKTNNRLFALLYYPVRWIRLVWLILKKI